MSADNAGSPYVDGSRRAEIDDVSIAYVSAAPPERDLFRILRATAAEYTSRAHIEIFESVCVEGGE